MCRACLGDSVTSDRPGLDICPTEASHSGQKPHGQGGWCRSGPQMTLGVDSGTRTGSQGAWPSGFLRLPAGLALNAGDFTCGMS